MNFANWLKEKKEHVSLEEKTKKAKKKKAWNMRALLFPFFLLLLLLGVSSFRFTYLRQRKWWLVGLAHKKPLQNDLVELGVGSSDKKLVELNEQLQVDVV